ncbi:MAG: hypothetical protein VX231_05065 [Pseudomonadota bacterium]|nr:hypothetical protein [Pseudomonadota bacterium]
MMMRQDVTSELQMQLNQLKAKDPERYKDVGSESVRRLKVRPDEVF